MKDFSLCTVVIGRYDIDKNVVVMLGTGFLIDESHVITALHVVNGMETNLRLLLPHIADINQFQDVDNNQCKTCELTITAADPMTDICILEVAIPLNIGHYWALGSLDNVSVGERIGIWGYPHCVEGRRILTYQETELGAKMLMSTSCIKSKYGTVNIQTRPGQSGSPVYIKETNIVVGMLVGAYAPNSGISIGGINPRELNQTSYCISAEYIKNMLS